MASCLICHRDEPGQEPQDPGPDLICSRCVQKLTFSNQEQIIEMYIAAVKKGRDRLAYALHSFVPVKFRQPLKIRSL